MNDNTYIYLLVAAVTVYAIRALPLTLIKKEITNTFIYSFLYYVPYVTLSVMTFPAILSAPGNVISSAIGFVAALVIAWIDGNLFKVALGACGAALISQLVINLISTKNSCVFKRTRRSFALLDV